MDRDARDAIARNAIARYAVFSAPIGYLTRPYIVYRSRDTAGRTRRGWEPV